MGFNAILRRTEFADETVWDWWVWGARAIVAPVMSLLIAGFALVLFAGARNLLRGASARVRQFDESVRRRAAAWANRLSMDDVSVLSSWLFLLSTTALVVTWWYFWPLMAAFGTTVSNATSDQLALLSPAYKEHHNAYRKALTLIVLLTTAGWYGVLKVSALRRQPLRASLALGSAAVLGLALVSLVVPYRLLYQNRVRTGELEQHVLLHHGRTRRRRCCCSAPTCCPSATSSCRQRPSNVVGRARASSPGSVRPRSREPRRRHASRLRLGAERASDMRRLCITLTLCLLVQAAAPPAAHAWLWEYFEEMSGPGPFTGWAFEWRLVCFSEPDPANRDAVETDDESKRAAAKLLQFFGPGCFFKQVPVQNRRTASINLKFGFLDAKENDLHYRSDRISRDVKMTTLTPSVAWRPTRSVETSFGVGVMWFSGPAFDSFTRVYVQPIQVDLKPLAAINQLRGADAVWWDELLSRPGGHHHRPARLRCDGFRRHSWHVPGLAGHAEHGRRLPGPRVAGDEAAARPQGLRRQSRPRSEPERKNRPPATRGASSSSMLVTEAPNVQSEARVPNAVQVPVRHHRRDHLAGAGDRGERGHLLHFQSHAAPAASGAGAAIGSST